LEADRAYLAETWDIPIRDLHADHVVPLKAKNVCGLHTPINLTIRTAAENIAKNNKIDLTRDAPIVEGHLDPPSDADITRAFSGEPTSSPTSNPAPALVRHFAQQHAALYAT
jgi:hypothetical protein